MARSQAILRLAAVAIASALRAGEGVRLLGSGSKEALLGGQRWHAQVVPDDWCQRPANESARSCAGGALKPRRGHPVVHYHEVVDMLRASPGNAVLPGPVNGWSAIADVQLQTLTCEGKGGGGEYLWRYSETLSGDDLVQAVRGVLASAATHPSCKSPVLRARLVAAEWTALGWGEGAPGFAYWFQAQDGEPRVAVGEDMIANSGDGRAVRAHIFTHRFAKKAQGSWMRKLQDGLTWHSGVVLEWDHGRYFTVAEVGWLNRGRCLWYKDIDAVLRHAPASMSAPFDDSRSEIRLLDIEAKTLDEVATFLEKYSERGELESKDQRFLQPYFPWEGNSGDVHLFRNRRADIARYITNYIIADGSYDLMSRNCQTFAADLYTFLTGIDVGTKSWPVTMSYTQHVDHFVEEPLAF